jgi:hypothetical protein
MSHPYDASTKYLVEARLADWLPLCGRKTAARAEIISADVGTVTAAADRVLRVFEDPAWLMHVELQASRGDLLLPNLAAYNTLLERRQGVLVRTVVVLLRRSADSPELTGLIQRGFPGEPPYLVFGYTVVRLWRLAAEVFLSGGLGILPLAPLSAVVKARLPAVIRRMDERIRAEATPDEAGTLWTATDVLMGLRYPRALVAQLLQGVQGMKESVTYQAIVEEGEAKGEAKGKVEGRQEDILRLGRRRLGRPSAAAQAALRDIQDPDHLARILDELYNASSWKELLATP